MWIIFELTRAKTEQEKWEEKINNISKNVFYALFGQNFKKIYMTEVMKTFRDYTFFRENFFVTYIMSERIHEDNGSENKIIYLELAAEVRFRMTNVGRETVKYGACLSLPNPINAKLKQYVKVRSIEFKRKGSENSIEMTTPELNVIFSDSLINSNEQRINYKTENLDIPEGEYVDVIMNYTMVKYTEDTEFLETGYPSDGLTIKVTKAESCQKEVGARSVHRLPITKREGDAYSTEFQICAPLLPHQGVLWWWE
jgi:hypothetical protein